jgi:FkbM family methyltransferase
MNVKILIKILNKIKGQSFWETLFRFSLNRMNYGNGGNFEQSGELNVLKHIQKYLGKDSTLTIFDVGANVGNYTKALSDFFKAKAIIHSFEPSKKTHEIFLKRTKNIQNIISNNVGFSDIETHQLLYTNADRSKLASIYKRDLEQLGISMDQSEMIKLSTIDRYCKSNNIDRIHFLKLDIEGNELKALIGAKEMISSKQIDFIQFEFGGSNIDSRTFFRDFYNLLKDNYRIYRILKDGLIELPTYKVTYEIFMAINYLAVKKTF